MSVASRHSHQSAAITGAGGGLGRDIALGLAAKGYIVFGTAISAAEVQDLKEASGGRVSLTVCDITKEQAVKAWAAGVSEALGGGGLDLLINNAGILTPGPLEVLPLDAIRHEFEVNVFGALSVMNAFLPALRTGTRSHRADQHLDREPSASFQRAVRRIEGGDGGFRDRLPGRVETLRNRRRGGAGRQYENRGPGENGGGARTDRRRDDASTARSVRTDFETFATALNSMQDSGLDSAAAARRVIELAEQTPRRAARRWERTRKRCSGSFARNPTPSRMHSACRSPA